MKIFSYVKNIVFLHTPTLIDRYHKVRLLWFSPLVKRIWRPWQLEVLSTLLDIRTRVDIVVCSERLKGVLQILREIAECFPANGREAVARSRSGDLEHSMHLHTSDFKDDELWLESLPVVQRICKEVGIIDLLLKVLQIYSFKANMNFCVDDSDFFQSRLEWVEWRRYFFQKRQIGNWDLLCVLWIITIVFDS